MTKGDFIKKAKSKYDYSLIPNDIKYKSYIDVICDKHGIINMRMDLLLKGSLCRKCSDENRSSKSNILQKFGDKYGDKYSYDLSEYKNINTKIKITCDKHGDFYTSSIGHLMGKVCSKCKSEEYTIDDIEIDRRTKKFISKCLSKYGDKYDYSKAKYSRSDEKVTVICKKHGAFQTVPSKHISGYGCKKCKFENFSDTYRHTTDQFITISKKEHGDFYDYSKVNYVDNKTKVEIICPEHGSFFQIPHSHKMGYGCQECNITLGERRVSVILQKLNIKYEFQKTFTDCTYINKLEYDFYLPEYNTCIEYDGIQHFEIVEYFGGEDNFKLRRERDIIKNRYCDDNNINLLRIPYYTKDIEKEIKIFLFS